MKEFQEEILAKAVRDLCVLYHKRITLLSQERFNKTKNQVFTEIISELYEKYKFDLGFMNNPSGFKSLLVKEKNRVKKLEIAEQKTARLVNFYPLEDEDILREEGSISWGDDVSSLSVEMQEKLGLNI